MLALIQRVNTAHVEVDGAVIGSAKKGIMALIGIEPEDDPTHAKKLCEKISAIIILKKKLDLL